MEEWHRWQVLLPCWWQLAWRYMWPKLFLDSHWSRRQIWCTASLHLPEPRLYWHHNRRWSFWDQKTSPCFLSKDLWWRMPPWRPAALLLWQRRLDLSVELDRWLGYRALRSRRSWKRDLFQLRQYWQRAELGPRYVHQTIQDQNMTLDLSLRRNGLRW